MPCSHVRHWHGGCESKCWLFAVPLQAISPCRGHYWILLLDIIRLYWCRTIRLMCFEIWEMTQTHARVSAWAFRGKTWLCGGEFEVDGAKFSYSCARYLFHFFAFPLAKLQENICHGFKRFISFKAEGAGRPTHQWDHAILPAMTRMS